MGGVPDGVDLRLKQQWVWHFCCSFGFCEEVESPVEWLADSGLVRVAGRDGQLRDLSAARRRPSLLLLSVSEERAVVSAAGLLPACIALDLQHWHRAW